MASEYTYVRPWLYPKQATAIFCRERYGIIEASSKAGKTFACLAWLVEQAMRCTVTGRNYWWVAPVFPQSRMAFRRLKHGLPPSVFTASDGEMKLTLGNGANVWFKSADNADSLYGEDVFAAVIDEASRVREDAWHAVRSTLIATQGPVRIIGNVKGRRNWFWQLARKVESGGMTSAHYARLTWHDAVAGGVMRESEVMEAKTQLPERVFKELFEAEASDDGGNPFGLAAIASRIAPLSNNPPVVWGIDLAKSSDWTVCVGLDAEGATCRLERWQGPWQLTIERIVNLVGKVKAVVDSTGAGDPVLEALQAGGRRNFEGFTFSAPSKQRLMEGLAVAIQRGRVSYPEGVMTAELEAFEFTYHANGVRYSAPDGLHDDCVCALALAIQGFTRPAYRMKAVLI